MSNDFIEQIEIKQFKCFNNFKAEGFKRVNLIGGKNNVGKTAFMEACLLSRAENTEDLYKKLLEIQTHRDAINQLLSTTDRQQDLRQLIMDNMSISIYIENYRILKRVSLRRIKCGKVEIRKVLQGSLINIFTRYTEIDSRSSIKHGLTNDNDNDMIFEFKSKLSSKEYSYSEIINILDISIKNTKYYSSLNFVSIYSSSDAEIIDIVGQVKIENKYDIFNGYLNEVFNVTVIDIIKNKPMLKVDSKYSNLSTFGQGIKSFINIIASILLLKDNVLFIDEIENGIHYSHFSRLWEIVLTLSKQQNVQVFATTHSKECIGAYARVSKRLEDKDITFIEFGRDRQKKITSITYDFEAFTTEIEQDQEIRGW
jgi:AAA15 family ATPase/GTPase